TRELLHAVGCAQEEVLRMALSDAAQAESLSSLSQGTTDDRRITAKETNSKAMELAEADGAFVERTLRECVAAIGCSVGVVAKVRLGKATRRKTGRGTKDGVAAPKVVSLTPSLEATVGDEGPELNRLVAEQRADMEPSPLEDDPPGTRPRRVRTRKRL